MNLIKSQLLKRSFFKSLIAIILFYSLIYINASDNDIVLHSASELDYPPFCMVTKDGKADGFSVELLKYVASITDMEISFKVGPWAEIKNELKMGELDVLPLVSYSKERAQWFDFTAPYLVLYGGIFTRKNNTTISTEKDLYGTEVIVMEGDSAHEYVFKNKLTDKIITVKSYTEAFKMLAAGKYDAVVVQKLVGLQIKDKLGLNNIKLVGKHQNIIEDTLKPLGRELKGFEQKFCFAVPRGKSATLAKLNEGLLIAVSDGTYNKLYNKWFPFLHNQVNITKVIEYVLLIIVVISIVILLPAFFILKKQIKMRLREIDHLSKFPSENPFPVIRVDFNKIILYANKGTFDILSQKDKKNMKILTFKSQVQPIISKLIFSVLLAKRLLHYP